VKRRAGGLSEFPEAIAGRRMGTLELSKAHTPVIEYGSIKSTPILLNRKWSRDDRNLRRKSPSCPKVCSS
jgi:hypothetical protein